MGPEPGSRRILAVIFRTDLRQAFRPRVLPPLFALAVIAVLLSVMRGDLSAPSLAVLAAFGILDQQFNAALSRSRTEWEALTLLPVPWHTVILGKNLATAAAWLVMITLLASVTLYFAPRFPSASDGGHAGLLAWTLMFPLLVTGNLRSVQEPRREDSTAMRDILLSIGMLLLAAACALPYILLTTLGGSILLSVLYGCGAGAFWWFWSIPKTASFAQSYLEHP
jgi:hypothetical protein